LVLQAAHQEVQVDDYPCQPRGEPAEPYPVYLGDGGLPADGGQRSLVPVGEGLCGAPGQAQPNGPGHVTPFLHRGGRGARYREGRAGAVRDAHHVAHGENLGKSGQRQIGLDGDPPGPVEHGAGRLRQRGSER
jgi:hypothetical protein